MRPPLPRSLRVRLAFLIAALFLWLMLMSIAGCSSPSSPSAAVPAPPRLRVVTVSGPPLPAILALPAEITRGTGLAASYVGETGGSMAFVVGSVPSEYCAWTVERTATTSTHVFPSVRAMENLDPEGGCNRLHNTALHETGHGLGLDHPPAPCAENVMCVDGPGLRRTERTWGPGDLAALRRIYS